MRPAEDQMWTSFYCSFFIVAALHSLTIRVTIWHSAVEEGDAGDLLHIDNDYISVAIDTWQATW